MSDTIIVALISALGTGAGAVVSVLTANRITNYKIERLEEEVRKHNGIIERTYDLETRTAILETKVDDLEATKK